MKFIPKKGLRLSTIIKLDSMVQHRTGSSKAYKMDNRINEKARQHLTASDIILYNPVYNYTYLLVQTCEGACVCVVGGWVFT